MPPRRRKSSKSTRRASALLGHRTRRANAARRSAAAKRGWANRRLGYAQIDALTTLGKLFLKVGEKNASLIGRHTNSVDRFLRGNEHALDEFKGKGGRFSDATGKRYILETRQNKLSEMHEA